MPWLPSKRGKRACHLAALILVAASAVSLWFRVSTAQIVQMRYTGLTADSKRQPCRECRILFNRDNDTGYPPVAFRGRKADFVSPSMFRDMADYVISWPWAHFDESVNQLPLSDLDHCLPAVPVVYWQPSGSPEDVAAITQRVVSFPKPFILITGQSDNPVPTRFPDVLSSPQLLRWFGQNNDMLPPHPKFTPIPIGLNCWEHCAAMERYLATRESDVDLTPTKKTFLVNFSPRTDARRATIRELFCDSSELAADTTCVQWVCLL